MNQGVSQGIVTYVDGPRYHVACGSLQVICVLRGRLKQKKALVTSLIAIGDLVGFSQNQGGGTAPVSELGPATGVIEEIYPRRTKLSRPGFHGYEHIIAVNIDQLVIVTSAHGPRFKRNIVDRFLLIARQGGIAPALVVNKADLEDLRVIRSWVEPLEATGIPILLTSAVSGLGISELRSYLKGKVSAFAGQSGVGKSSLVNALYPELGIRTQGVSVHAKGKHTTTSSRLYPLGDEGFLADTPGIKTLALWEAHEDELDEVFPEIEGLARGCKFRDCSHSHEPGCAVRSAVNAGKLDRGRFENFQRMQRESQSRR